MSPIRLKSRRFFATGLSLVTACVSACGVSNLGVATPANSAEVAIGDFNPRFRREWLDRLAVSAEELESHRRRWSEAGVRSYSYVCSKYIGGTYSPWNRNPVRITVSDAKMKKIALVNPKSHTLLDRTDGFEEFDDLNKLFAYLKEALDSGSILNVDYDETYGFPKRAMMRNNYSSHPGPWIVVEQFEVTKGEDK